MRNIEIPDNDTMSFDDFKAGKPIQVRTRVKPGEELKFEKGTEVRVRAQAGEDTVRIVSAPLIIEEKDDENMTVLSLIVEKK